MCFWNIWKHYSSSPHLPWELKDWLCLIHVRAALNSFRSASDFAKLLWLQEPVPKATFPGFWPHLCHQTQSSAKADTEWQAAMPLQNLHIFLYVVVHVWRFYFYVSKNIAIIQIVNFGFGEQICVWIFNFFF